MKTVAGILYPVILTTLVASAVAAQSAAPRKGIPAIAKAANGAIVSIIMSNKDGHVIAQGTGFVVSKDGHIVTNYHVIENGSSAVAKLPDGAYFVVDGVLALDKARDVAIIKAHGENFRTLALGNSDRLQVGEEVVAIGNPLSLESTVSNGIVSGIRTVKEEGGKFLQVTTPISPGSSGGPLFNMAGEVVGITTLYLKGGENLNFAIPINDVKHLLVTRIAKVQDFPNEPEESTADRISEDAGAACSFIMSRMSTALPQSPTLCEQAPSTTAQRKISVFSPVPVLGGGLRRAWSTTLFQTLQAAAKDGPCQNGCSVSVSDSRMASRSMHYEMDISKVLGAVRTDFSPGGFGSDQGYFFGWLDLLDGTKNDLSGDSERTESLGDQACKDYVKLLHEDRILAENLKSDSHYRFPTCSVMLATASSVYIVLDFPDSFMSALGNFREYLPKAFNSLDRYEGAVISRGPWDTYNGNFGAGVVRNYNQDSLHWLGFVHDEIASGVRSAEDASSLLHWYCQNWNVFPNRMVTTGIARQVGVYKIQKVGTSSQVQLMDGTEWSLSPDSLSRCSLKLGDEVSVSETKSANGEKDSISLMNGPCNLNASFVATQ